MTIGDDKYVVDVGFGPNGPTRPLLIRHGATCMGIAPAEARLIKESIAANTDSGQKPWIYQIRSGPEENWHAAYCFYEIEFLPSDYEMMNFSTSQNTRSIFTKAVICTKFLLNDANDDIVGCLSIVKEKVKRNLNGNVEILQVLKSEGERVDALKDLFNIHLLPLEARGIRGKATELKDESATAF